MHNETVTKARRQYVNVQLQNVYFLLLFFVT